MTSFSDPFSKFGSTGLGNNGFEVSLNYISGVPDLNTVVDPKLKIIFKSFLKKDDTTKEKLLIDFLKVLSDDSESVLINDDMIVISWVQLYPKLAIDVSKNVRLNSHLVQSKFVQILGKRYAKYLKDTAAIWLAGTFDPERVVSKSVVSSLTAAFQTQEKVDLLWKMFADKILNFCYQVLKFETRETLSDERNIGRDEAEAKYIRVLLSAVNVFTKLLTGGYISHDKADLYENVLNLDELWELISTKDLNLKKSCLMLIITLVKNQPELVNEKLFKTLSKSVIKSLNYKPATNNIVYSIIALPTISCILNLSSFKNEFWDLGGKKSKQKFLSFLELGSCSSSEIYYDLLEKILLRVPVSIIDWSNDGDYTRITLILLKDIGQEKLIPFKNRVWSCFFSLQIKFYKEQLQLVSLKLKEVMLEYLNKSLSKDIIKSSVSFFKAIDSVGPLVETIDILLNALPNGEINSQLVENVFDVLRGVDPKLLDSILVRSFDSLEKLNDDGTNYKPPVTSFIIFNKIISSNLLSFKDDIDSFLENGFASYVEKNFVEEPLALLIAYNNSKVFVNVKILDEAFDMMFSKLLMLDEKLAQNMITKLPRLTNVDVDLCPDVKSFLVGKSESFDYVDSSKNNMMFNFLTKDIFINLFKNSVESQSEDTFVSQFLTKFDKNILSDFLQSGDESVQRFFSYLFKNVRNSNSLHLIQSISEDEDDILIKSLMTYVTQNKVLDIDEVISYLKSYKPSVTKKIFGGFDSDSLISRINLAIGELVDLRLAIANPLEGNILISFTEITSTFDSLKTLELVLYANMLLEFIHLEPDFDVKVISCLALIGEIAMDHIFLFKADGDDKLMDFHTRSTEILRATTSDLQLGDCVNSIYGETSPSSFSSELLDFLKKQTEGRSALSFYFNRVLKSILTNLVEDESLQGFEKLEINFNKLMVSPLRFTTLIISCRKFLTSTKFERVRNLIASELIGLKTDQILSKGLTYLSMLDDFLLCDSMSYQIDTFVPIPEQRFNLVMRDFNNWMESDIAYENEFMLVRIQLISFINNYISIATKSNALDIDKALQMGFTLFRDSIGVVSVEQGNTALKELVVPLRYSALKLFIILSKNKGDIEAWDDDIEGVYEELVDSLLSMPKLDTELDQSSVMINQLYYRIFDSLIPIKFLKQDEFYKLMNCSGDLQRLGVNVLDKLILAQQQDYVIEYELSRSKLSLQDMHDDDFSKAKIPQQLIDCISQVPEEYVEYEDLNKMNKYIWGWYLIFDHFKDITQRMREDYIKQLRPEFEIFFKFVFDQIDLSTDLDLIKRLSLSGEIKNYSLATSGSSESYIEEQKQLIIHLCYLSFENVGSLVQSWFNTIRDRQLKLGIEKFSINFISPIVIDNELNKASKLLNNDTNINDENLTIKINRATHEIKSLYLIDEKTMEMVIRIPSSYPLQSVVVDGPVRLGVKESQWKSWLLASQRIITSQNSTIMGAIELFNKNVSLHFSGFEECAICYSILHYQDNSLPSKTCTTCNNKFHAGCLYKWFKSSGGSTCPLCRSTFNFRK